MSNIVKKDSELYQSAIKKYKEYYGKAPNSITTDGGYASNENLQFSIKAGMGGNEIEEMEKRDRSDNFKFETRFWNTQMQLERVGTL